MAAPPHARPPRFSRTLLVVHAVLLALVLAPLAWFSFDYVIQPGLRDPRSLTLAIPLIAAATFLIGSTGLVVAGVQRPGWWRVLSLIVAGMAGLLAPAIVIEPAARAREQRAMAAVFEPLIEEMRRRPASDLESVLRLRVGPLWRDWRMAALDTRFSWGRDGFLLAPRVRAMARDDDAWLVYQSAQGTWTRVEAHNGVEDPALPPLPDERTCSCRQPENGPWQCTPPCGTAGEPSPGDPATTPPVPSR
jgi:hypothetical protein